VLRAIREDEDAARSLGKNAFSYKLQSFVVGGALGALAGIMFAIDRQAVRPEFFFTGVTFYAFTIVILGGPGRVFSPVVGSVIFWFIISFTDGLIREAVQAGHLSVIDTTDLAAVRFALVGLLLMALILVRPQGIFGKRKELFLGD
jgi:branched-chain amino acid transport system permease protein